MTNYSLFWFPFLGLTLKCITNGNLPEFDNSCKDCEHRDRFAEKIVECGDGTCGKITGPTFGSQPLLLCAPKFDAGEKIVSNYNLVQCRLVLSKFDASDKTSV